MKNKELLEQARKKNIKTRQATLLLTLVPFLAGATLIYYSINTIEETETELEKVKSELTFSDSTLDVTSKQLIEVIDQNMALTVRVDSLKSSMEKETEKTSNAIPEVEVVSEEQECEIFVNLVYTNNSDPAQNQSRNLVKTLPEYVQSVLIQLVDCDWFNTGKNRNIYVVQLATIMSAEKNNGYPIVGPRISMENISKGTWTIDVKKAAKRNPDGTFSPIQIQVNPLTIEVR